MLTIDAGIWIAVYDPHDLFHHESTLFLTAAAQRSLALYGPAFVVVEACCALARRTQDTQEANRAIQQLNENPLLMLLPVNERLLATATELGVRYRVRGADSLYVATAALTKTQLITWDTELIRRAAAITPTDWLASHPA